MPNHFHFVLNTTINSTALVQKSNLPVQNLTEGIRLTLSGYTKGFNKAHGLSGNLFQQKTKAKLLSGGNAKFIAFHYVHQNPKKAGLVKRMEDWEFSSFNEYYKQLANPLCNKELGIQLIGFDPRKFYEESYKVNVELLESSIL
jgi:putative transposase